MSNAMTEYHEMTDAQRIKHLEGGEIESSDVSYRYDRMIEQDARQVLRRHLYLCETDDNNPPLFSVSDLMEAFHAVVPEGEVMVVRRAEWRSSLDAAEKRLAELERYLSPVDFHRMALVEMADQDGKKRKKMAFLKDQNAALIEDLRNVRSELVRAKDACSYWEFQARQQDNEIKRLYGESLFLKGEKDALSRSINPNGGALVKYVLSIDKHDGDKTSHIHQAPGGPDIMVRSDADAIIAGRMTPVHPADAPILDPMQFDELIDNLDGFFALAHRSQKPVECFAADRTTHRPVGRVTGLMYRDDSLFIMLD